MSTEANQAALQAFWNSTAPLSQVRENLNPPNGQYDLVTTKLEPAMFEITDKKDGRKVEVVGIQGEFTITAPASIANAKVGNVFKRRFYIGTTEDAEAKLPETRLNSSGFSTLKSIGRASQVPTNDQQIAALAANLLGKGFSARIETTKSKKDGKEYCDFGRNFSPLGVLPAKLDSEGASATAAPAPVANGAAAVPAGTVIS